MSEDTGELTQPQPDLRPTSENNTNAELIGRVQGLLRSNFGLTNERVDINSQMIGTESIIPGELPDDAGFRQEIEKIIEQRVLDQNGRTLVLLKLATQHAVATLEIFYNHGVDCYLTLFPPDVGKVSPDKSYYSGGILRRVCQVVSANEGMIQRQKDSLTKENLRGLMINIDAHAGRENDAGEFDNYLPKREKLEELGINKVVLLAETSPGAAEGMRDYIMEPDGQKLGLAPYLRSLAQAGIPFSIHGIDTRKQESQIKFQADLLSRPTSQIFIPTDLYAKKKTPIDTTIKTPTQGLKKYD